MNHSPPGPVTGAPSSPSAGEMVAKSLYGKFQNNVFLVTEVPVDECAHSGWTGWLLVSRIPSRSFLSLLKTRVQHMKREEREAMWDPV